MPHQFLARMVSKTRRRARKSAEAMREMLEAESDLEENHNNSENVSGNSQPVLVPTSTTRLDAEDEFVRLSHRIDSEIDKGLSASLLQFESRLEAALDSIRQTVTNSLGARSQPYTDHESDADRERSTMSASGMQRIASAKLQGGSSDRNAYHVGEQSQVTIPNWFDSQTSLCERTTNEVHLATTNAVNGSGYNSPRTNLSRSNSHVFTTTGYQPTNTESSETRNVTTNLPLSTSDSNYDFLSN